jgi:hypothetical protein
MASIGAITAAAAVAKKMRGRQVVIGAPLKWSRWTVRDIEFEMGYMGGRETREYRVLS